MAVKNSVLRWPYKFLNAFLKILRLSDFRIFLSILFHSITVEGKKEFLRKSCVTLKDGTFSTYLVKYDLLDTEKILRRYVGDCLLKIL